MSQVSLGVTMNSLRNGSVSQRGEFSTDEAKTWSLGYDFTYRRSDTTMGQVGYIVRRTITGTPMREVPHKRK